MAISYFAEDVKMPAIPKRKITSWIKTVASGLGYKVGDVSYVFCSDNYILKVNKDYLQHDYYTDIITFDYTEKDIISGDIFISTDTVASNSEKFGTRFEDELHRVIIHGILHLCGIKDKKPEERAFMEENENKALELLKI
jgi:rRNA maturation RNase YbeY